MNRFICFILLLGLATPGRAAKKVTVQELGDTLQSLYQAKKDDDEVATRLKEIELSEELTRPVLDRLAAYIPGPLAQEQMNVLEGRSAILAPPPSDLPATPVPDASALKAILTKAAAYTRIYMQNPHLAAFKSIARYQDGVEGIRTNSGVTSNMPNVGRSWEPPNMFMRFIGSHRDSVETDKGVEQIPVEKSKVPWGINGQVSEGALGPTLSTVVQEATDSGKLNWLRWQTIAGKPFAVFSFSVDKKKSQYVVDYCCFPVTQDTGRMGYEGTAANFQTGTDWKDFKSTVPYRGELFIDPDSGTIVRLITQATLKPTDFVHQQDTRIDFAPAFIDGRAYILPVHSFTLTEVVPNGDNYAARYSIRHTLFIARYQNYQLAGSAAAEKQ